MTKPTLHAYVTPEAKEAMASWAANQGVSMSAILEALCLTIDTDEPLDRDRLVEAARAIDASRRSRNR